MHLSLLWRLTAPCRCGSNRGRGVGSLVARSVCLLFVRRYEAPIFGQSIWDIWSDAVLPYIRDSKSPSPAVVPKHGKDSAFIRLDSLCRPIPLRQGHPTLPSYGVPSARVT